MIYSKEFLLFLLAGSVAALANFLSRIYLNKFFSYGTSIFFAYCLGMLIAYFLMKIFVFKSSKNSNFKSSLYFTFINLLAVFQTWAVSLYLANSLLPSINLQQNIKEIAHAVGIIVPLITSYYGHKLLTFKK